MFYTKAPKELPQGTELEVFDVWVWEKDADDLVPVYGASLPDWRDMIYSTDKEVHTLCPGKNETGEEGKPLVPYFYISFDPDKERFCYGMSDRAFKRGYWDFFVCEKSNLR